MSTVRIVSVRPSSLPAELTINLSSLVEYLDLSQPQVEHIYQIFDLLFSNSTTVTNSTLRNNIRNRAAGATLAAELEEYFNELCNSDTSAKLLAVSVFKGADAVGYCLFSIFLRRKTWMTRVEKKAGSASQPQPPPPPPPPPSSSPQKYGLAGWQGN
ncbi:hypothetical protein TWF718_005774 [Orbilia javanica]|uniref:Uncharacterized protein n=1 Tax=Orbilia javanica TaxID=47235 RepID=A0AAN8MVM8_9PEZI